MKFEYILMLLLVSLFVSCTNRDNVNVSKSNLLSSINEYFVLVDSIDLSYPVESFPDFIFDICMNKSSFYMVSKTSKYPIVEFDKHGNFKNYIGKNGNGPGEFRFQPVRISCKKDTLAIIQKKGYPNLTLFKGTRFLISKDFSAENKFSDIFLLNGGNILISCVGESKNQLIVLDNKLNIEKKLYVLPDDSKMYSWVSFYPTWNIQPLQNSFLINTVYPPNVLLIEDVSKNSHVLQKNIFKFLTSFQTVNYSDNIKPSIKVFQSFSKLIWISKIEDYFYGLYTMRDKTDTLHPIFFITNKNKILLEKVLDPPINILYLIPHNDKLYTYKYIEKNQDIIIRFYILKPDLSAIETLKALL